MEYAEMLRAPGLVSGLRDLLADPDPAVVKRTVRVFANVYRHSLQLLATGELSEETFRGAWPSVKMVAEDLMYLVESVENEGILIHIVRFLEAALIAHLLSDISRFPEIAAQTPELVELGINALKLLINTPYIGGSAYLVAIRAIITVACYKPDLWEPVTALIEKQIASPPPTLFDHNVRSLHKTLQRNLFRLLRRATSVSLRSQLVEMMVTVGVPRRMLSQWAPRKEPRKRTTQMVQNEDAITGRNSPPTKRFKENAEIDEIIGRATPPRDPRENRDSIAPCDPRESRQTTLLRDPRESVKPRDPRTKTVQDPRISPPLPLTEPMSPVKPKSPPPEDIPIPAEPKPRSPIPGHSNMEISDTQKPSSSGRSSGRSTPESKPESSSKKEKVKSSFEFLKNIIVSTSERNSPAPYLERCNEREKMLYEWLDQPRVVDLVMSCIINVPDSPPKDLECLKLVGSDVEKIREYLATTLAPHLEDFVENQPSLNENVVSRPSSTASAAFSSRTISPPNTLESSPPSPPSSNRSTPTDFSQTCNSDIDLRHILNRGFTTVGDVDMRTNNAPKQPSRDPRSMKTNQTGATDPRKSGKGNRGSNVTIQTSSVMDPRITMMDSRIPKPFADTRDPRMENANSCPNPNMFGTNSSLMGNPPIGLGNMLANPVFDLPNNSGILNSNLMNRPDPRILNDPSGPGIVNSLLGLRNGVPGNGKPHNDGLMGGRGLMHTPGMDPNIQMGPMQGPWQGNMQANRMGMMMPVMNNGQGIFSVPPMHL